MNRDEAATLLGIDVDADIAAIRRAWRLWAKVSHPDVGGDPIHFARLQQARQVMMQTPPGLRLPEGTVPPSMAPRRRLRTVVHTPARPVLLAVMALLSVATAALPHLLAMSLAIPLVFAAVPAALAATAWAVMTSRAVLLRHADRGHRIALMMLLWLPIVACQLILSMLLTPSLLPVLPALALPIVAVVATANLSAQVGRTAAGGD